MKAVYEVVVSNGLFSSEKWLFTSDSLQVAVEKAQKKLNRAPRLYENFVITQATALRGSLIN
jgi:hypothetical protein